MSIRDTFGGLIGANREKNDGNRIRSEMVRPITTTDLPRVSAGYITVVTGVQIVIGEWRRVAIMSPSRWQIRFVLNELDDVFIMPFRPSAIAGGMLINPSNTYRTFHFRDDPPGVTGEWYARSSLVGPITLWVIETVPTS